MENDLKRLTSDIMKLDRWAVKQIVNSRAGRSVDLYTQGLIKNATYAS